MSGLTIWSKIFPFSVDPVSEGGGVGGGGGKQMEKYKIVSFVQNIPI